MQRTITVDDLLAWGATDFYDRPALEQFFKRKSLSVASIDQVFDSAQMIGSCAVFWVVVRPELLSERIMRLLGVALGNLILANARDADEQLYVDFRTPLMLEQLAAYANGEISVGEYQYAVHRAVSARTLVAELDRPLTTAVADAVAQIGKAEVRRGFRIGYAIAEEALPKSFGMRAVECVRERLHELLAERAEMSA